MRPAARRTLLVRARRTVLVRKVVSDETGPLDSAGNQRLLATPLLSWPVDTFLQDVHCLGIELATDQKKGGEQQPLPSPTWEEPRLSLSRGIARPICLHAHGALRQLSDEE